jgi:hypothetical protein
MSKFEILDMSVIEFVSSRMRKCSFQCSGGATGGEAPLPDPALEVNPLLRLPPKTTTVSMI